MKKTKELKSTRDGFGEAILRIGEKNKDVVVLCADLSNSLRVLDFKKKFPKRFVEVGVAEQNMAGLAAGLALTGKIPFVCSFAVFSPGVNWSQIRVSICQNNANVKIIGSHAGVEVGPDGMSHQALEDIALMRCLPGMTVLVPCDASETKRAVEEAVKHKGPVYIRLGREKVSDLGERPFKIGKAEILRKGKDVAVVACGSLVFTSLAVAEKLSKEGIDVCVINNHTVKPIDKNVIIKIAKDIGAIVTAEDHQLMGGLGSAVAEVLATNHSVPIEMVGIQDRWGESGKPEELIKKFNLDVDSIIKSIKKVLKRKNVK